MATTNLGPATLDLLTRGYGIKVLGSLPGRDSVYIQPGFDGDGGAPGASARLWFICDNGGEFNVSPVNCHDEMRSVAYADHRGAVDPGTMAYRIAMVVRGEEIDWDFRWPELVEELRAAWA